MYLQPDISVVVLFDYVPGNGAKMLGKINFLINKTTNNLDINYQPRNVFLFQGKQKNICKQIPTTITGTI